MATTVVASTCTPGAGSQQWTGYNDGTLRTGGRCLDVTGPGAGARARVAACTAAASQKWEIGQVSSNDFGPVANAGTGTVLSYPRGSIADGTPLVMGPDLGDQSSPLARLLPPLHDLARPGAVWLVRGGMIRARSSSLRPNRLKAARDVIRSRVPRRTTKVPARSGMRTLPA